tara:strand:- start:318 stop:476 length:159 start_codon:yes stop_codon:yes gene_type:complete
VYWLPLTTKSQSNIASKKAPIGKKIRLKNELKTFVLLIISNNQEKFYQIIKT